MAEETENTVVPLPDPGSDEEDPILQLRGLGKDLWAEEGGGDAYVARERAAWDQSTE